MPRPLIILLSLVLLLLGAWGLMILVTRGPLGGERHHDFGEVLLPPQGNVHLQHSFQLVNRTAQTLMINSVRPDCGCVVVERWPSKVGPGERFEIPVTINVSRNRDVRLYVDFEGASPDMLRLSATARFQSYLAFEPRPASPDEGIMRFMLTAIMYQEAAPAPPRLEAPDGFQAIFGGWRQTRISRDPRLIPHTWEGALEVRQVAAEPGEQPRLVVHCPPLEPLEIDLASGPPARSFHLY